MSESKDDFPSVLILGGVGFIGRNLVEFLVENGLSNKIRVADKKLPIVAGLSEKHSAIFKQKEVVDFKQADLAQDAHIKKVFDQRFDIVVNLCGETRFGCSENDYKLKCVDTAAKASAAAAEKQCGVWIEVSSGQVYNADKKPSTESSKTKPWTKVAAARLAAESEVAKSGIKHVILRPSNVYGTDDTTSLMPRITCGAVYAHMKEKLQFMWSRELKINTVHVVDVAGAIWAAATTTGLASGAVYNVSDSGDTDQGTLNDHIASIFGISVGCVGTTKSSLAKMMLGALASDANDKHVPVWTKMCQEQKIDVRGVSPYIDKELLYNNSLCLDGSKITKDTKFTYSVPQCTKEELEKVIIACEESKQFPIGIRK